MLDEKTFQKLRKSIVKSILTKDNRHLSIVQLQWIFGQYWLKTDQISALTYDFKRYKRKEFDVFSNDTLYEWVCGDTDLNYALSWILHWIERHNGDPVNVLDALNQFKQRCKLVQLIRSDIGLKTFSIHYLYSHHVYKRRDSYNVYNKFDKSVLRVYAITAEQAIKDFFARYRPCEKDMRRFKINRIRMVNSDAPYMIYRDARMPNSIYQFLCDGSDAYTGPDVQWSWPPTYA